jgi:hypothetical protein
MAQLATDVHIFLSSTFLDLKELREKTANRLRDVFGAHMLVMETSGSDDAPPVISSIRRLRECDIFVGVYARRYGSLDPATGLSITELELCEAERSLSAGTLTAILLYWLDESAAWPTSICEADPAAVAKLASLRAHSRQHTYTTFCDPDDLPFLIIRDVLAKIRTRMSESSIRARQQILPEGRRLKRPVGMEFLTSADRQHLYGRVAKMEELLASIEANEITLLLGNSGSGKTSLIHAGLLPDAVAAGWFVVYTRPLGFPRTDVISGLNAAVFEGPQSYRGALIGPLESAAAAVAPKRVLLVIDQFEDILAARDSGEAERLVEDLRSIRYMNLADCRVLVSYRADLEARLGGLWQVISGSPSGLPRVYVAGIGPDEAWMSVESACRDLDVTLTLVDTERGQIKHDLQAFSAQQGENEVYPPYIQMLIDQIWRRAEESQGIYYFKDYVSDGAMEGITAGYLSRQLDYANDPSGHLKSVLVSLVRSYGVKAQKSLAEISADIRVGNEECEAALERLIDLRLVRHIADLYEIAHDFLAREISFRLVDSEEREFKRVRELLASKSATYATTRSLLTVEELLLLFKYRDRLLPSDGELSLITASWAEGKGPGLQLLLGTPQQRLVELIQAEEGAEQVDNKDRAMLALLRRKASRTPLDEKEWMLFRAYRRGMELAAMIDARSPGCPDSLLLWALRSNRRRLREAALKAIARKLVAGEFHWIEVLSKSSSALYRSTYERLVLDEAIPMLPIESLAAPTRQYREFWLLQRASRAETPQALLKVSQELRRFRPRARTLLFGRAVIANRNSGLASTLNGIRRHDASKAITLLNSIQPNMAERYYPQLIDSYFFWNRREAGFKGYAETRLRTIYESKATAVAEAILRTSSEVNLELLRSAFQQVALTTSSQYLATALICQGDASDIVAIIKRIETAESEIRYWYQVEIGQIAGRRMRDLGGPIPPELLQIVQRDDFHEDPRSVSLKSAHRLERPLKSLYNRALYIRLVAHALIGASRRDDLELLKDLSLHNYRLVARAAAIRLAQLGREVGFGILKSAVTDAIAHQRAEAFGLAVRDAEIEDCGLLQLW